MALFDDMLKYAKAMNEARAQQQALNAASRIAYATPNVANMNAYARALMGAAEAQRKVKETDPSEMAAKLARNQLLVAGAYALASAKMLSWISAGLSGTVTGEHLSYQMQQLSRQIASLFLPAIEKGIKQLSRLVEWFRSLTGAQQQSIARWTALGVGMLGVLTLLPKLGTGLGYVGAVLRAAIASNPFIIVAGAIVALMARTEEGRSSLVSMGESFVSAFAKVADVLGDVLIPLLDHFTELMNKPIGKFVLFGALGAAAVLKIISMFQALRTVVWSTGGAIGAALGAVILIAAAIGAATNSTREFAKSTADVLEQVKRGQMTPEKAREEIKIRAAAKAEEETEEVFKKRQGLLGFNAPPPEVQELYSEEFRKKKQQELEEAGLERFERGLKRLGAGTPGRSDVIQSRTGTEDPRATIRRLEDAILKTGADKVQRDQLDELKKIREAVDKKEPVDKREKPIKQE